MDVHDPSLPAEPAGPEEARALDLLVRPESLDREAQDVAAQTAGFSERVLGRLGLPDAGDEPASLVDRLLGRLQRSAPAQQDLSASPQRLDGFVAELLGRTQSLLGGLAPVGSSEGYSTAWDLALDQLLLPPDGAREPWLEGAALEAAHAGRPDAGAVLEPGPGARTARRAAARPASAAGRALAAGQAGPQRAPGSSRPLQISRPASLASLVFPGAGRPGALADFVAAQGSVASAQAPGVWPEVAPARPRPGGALPAALTLPELPRLPREPRLLRPSSLSKRLRARHEPERLPSLARALQPPPLQFLGGARVARSGAGEGLHFDAAGRGGAEFALPRTPVFGALDSAGSDPLASGPVAQDPAALGAAGPSRSGPRAWRALAQRGASGAGLAQRLPETGARSFRLATQADATPWEPPLLATAARSYDTADEATELALPWAPLGAAPALAEATQPASQARHAAPAILRLARQGQARGGVGEAKLWTGAWPPIRAAELPAASPAKADQGAAAPDLSPLLARMGLRGRVAGLGLAARGGAVAARGAAGFPADLLGLLRASSPAVAGPGAGIAARSGWSSLLSTWLQAGGPTRPKSEGYGLPGSLVSPGPRAAELDAAGPAAAEEGPRPFRGAGLGQRLGTRVIDRRLRGAALLGKKDSLPALSAWAQAVGEGAPRNGLPVAGGNVASHGFHLDVDLALMQAVDAWESAYPGRVPYITPRGEGEGKEEPDLRAQSALPPGAAPLPPQRRVGRSPGLGQQVANLLRDLGLDGAAAQEPGYRPGDGVQGGEPVFDMSLVRPIMTVVTQRSQPLLSEGPVAAPDKPGDTVAEEQIEIDPQKLDHVIDMVYGTIWDLMELEQQRRGW